MTFTTEHLAANPTTPTPSLSTIYQLDLGLLPCLVECEQTGCILDLAQLKSLEEPTTARLAEITDLLRIVADDPKLNPNSRDDLARLLFDVLELPTHRRWGRSTKKAALETIKDHHSIVPMVMEYKRLSKMQGTYIANLPKMVDADGRFRPMFNNVSVETGRLSAKMIQLIPRKIEDDTPPFVAEMIRGIRKAFIAPPGMEVFSYDQEAVEYRVLVSLANDRAAIDAILSGKDIHSMSACRWLGREYTDLRHTGVAADKDARDLAKTTVYGSAYGQTPIGLRAYMAARGKQVSNSQAADIQQLILGPDVVAWKLKQAALLLERGFVETHWGRQIHYPDLVAASDEAKRCVRRYLEQGYLSRPEGVRGPRDIWVVEAALREGGNAIIQGSAADFKKKVDQDVWKEKTRRKMHSRFWSMVHDETNQETPLEEVDDMREIVERIAPNVVDLPLPLSISIGTGPNWASAH